MATKRRFLKRGALIAGNHNRSLAAGIGARQHTGEAPDLSPDDHLYGDLVSSGSEGEQDDSNSRSEVIERQRASGAAPPSPNKSPRNRNTESGRRTPPSPASRIMISPHSPSTGNNSNAQTGSGCVAKLLTDDTLWGPMGRPMASHTDVSETFHDTQHSFMRRISITNITIRFALQYCTEFGQSVRIVGSVPMLGDWNAARAPQMTWTEGDIWVLDLPVPIAFHRDHGRADSVFQSEPDPILMQFDYKYVLTNSTAHSRGEPSEQTIQALRWEEGPNHQFVISESAVIERKNATHPPTIWDTWHS